MAISRIRVPSSFYRHTIDPTMDNGGYVIKTADFQLGLGPCEKIVERLEVQFHSYGVKIIQHCTCTEMKEFVYPWGQLTGRVEVTHV